jgi:hypothetical protein
VKTEAHLSPDRMFRYWLLRIWNERLPICASIGVNPSTADERENDPTIRKDIGFASRMNFGGILKLNVGAFRSTDPKAWRHAPDPFGPQNTPIHLKRYVQQFGVELVIAAWGRNGGYYPARCGEICKEFPVLWCFGMNPDLTPKHTLMLPYITPLVRFSMAGWSIPEGAGTPGQHEANETQIL